MESTPPLALRLREPLRDYPLVPGEVPTELDLWLNAQDAKSWTLFLALGSGDEDEPRARRAARKELVKRKAVPAELLDPASSEPPLEGFLVLDLEGEKARSLGRKLGVQRYLRGFPGRPFDPEPRETESEDTLAAAQRGLVEMAHMIPQLPRRMDANSVATLAAAVILLASLAAAYFTPLAPPASLPPGYIQVLGPLLFFGAYLRWHIHGSALGATTSEPPGWERSRYQLLAVWIAAVPLVLAFGAAELWLEDRLSVTRLFDELPTPLVLVLWLLPAVSLPRTAGEFFGNLFAAGFNAFLSVILLKFAYMLASLATGIFWSMLGPLLGGFLPTAVVDPDGIALEVLAELAFLFTLLGYAWTRQRPWFEGDPHPLEA